ncbi:MAG TPA: hypothetical protein VN673_12370 [Clostridia bacterium]|nr:hypothetical protein [Clostridia bacterium]
MRRAKTVTILVAGALFGGNLLAYVPETRRDAYEAIPERNLFGLKPAAKPAAPQETAEPALPKMVLTGITTILGNKRALLKAVPPGNKPGEQSKERSFILTEGQQEDFVEVIQINEDQGSVTLRNSGAIMTLTFDKDGPKLPNTAPGPGQGGAPIPAPALGTYPTTPAQAGAIGRQTPTRTFRLPAPAAQGGQAAAPSAYPQPSTPTYPQPDTTAAAPSALTPAGQASIPSPTSVGTTPTTPTDTTITVPMSPEEQAALMEFQREANRGGVDMAPLPTGPESGPSYVYPSNPMPPGAVAPGRTPPLIPYFTQ